MDIRQVNSLFNFPNIIENNLDDYKSQLCFRESLIVGNFENKSQKFPTPVGGMCIDIEAALENKYVVYVSSKFNIGNSSGGSKITTWIDSYFYTIEEKRVEFINGERTEKQSLYMGSDKDGMIISHKLNNREKRKIKYSNEITNALISEGSNFLIMRLLALCMYEGKIEFTAMYINGDICQNIYHCCGVIPGTVNNVETDVVKINRIIIEKCGIVHLCSTILTHNGHIVKQDWDTCSYVIQLNPLQDPVAFAITGAACSGENVLSLVSGWQDDLELMSKYLDQRKIYEYTTKGYIEETPELIDLLADYVKSLLQNKPEKVLDFTSDYFMRYGG